MNLNINYEFALDWGHCLSIHEAGEKFSQITNLLNKVLAIRQGAKKDILEACSKFPGEQMHKFSWENKMVRLSELSNSGELMTLWQDADSAYRQLRNKQAQILEDLLALKKVADITPK
jgi:hypothetical protein